MKICVTGGAGYIGSVLTPILLNEGFDVTVVDTFMYHRGSLDTVKDHPKLNIIEGDARDKDLMAGAMRDVDAIFPLACYTGAPLCDKDPKAAEDVNLGAVRLILELRRPEQKIIFPTTNSGYGVGEKGKHCTEETPLRPVSLYGKLKVQAEEDILNSGNAVTLRLATAFGVSPRMRLDLLVNDFTYKAVKDKYIEIFEGHFMRNYIHVRDISKAFVHMLNNFDAVKDQTYNVGLSSANLSKLELARTIQKQVPDFQIVESPTGKDPDQRDYIVSNEKIERTGFRPDVSLDQGIKELIALYQSLDKANAPYALSNV